MSFIKPQPQTYFCETFEDQNIFIEAVLSGKYKNLMFAGDIRSGKTICLLLCLVLLCKVFPGSRWAVIRKDRPKLVKTTIPTFFKYCCPPKFAHDFNRSELTFTAKNGSQILFLPESFEKDPDLTSFWGLEVNGFFLNQSDELQKDMFDMSVMRRGQWRIDPMPPAITLLDCNPTSNWSKPEFYDTYMNEELPPTHFLKLADINKNPYITEEYKADLKRTLPPELWKRFCENNWDVVDQIMQLVPWDDIRACKEKIDSSNKEKSLGGDIGHDGPDPSIWTIMDGDNIKEIIRIDKTKTWECVAKTKQIMAEERIGANKVCLDSVGIGAGVCDEMEKDGFYIIKFKGGNACDQEITGTNFTFKNMRAYSNWLLAEEIKKHLLGGISNTKLISDCGAIKYEIKGDKAIYIQSKEEIKKKLKRSPDYWDSLTYANWARMYDKIGPKPGIFSL